MVTDVGKKVKTELKKHFSDVRFYRQAKSLDTIYITGFRGMSPTRKMISTVRRIVLECCGKGSIMHIYGVKGEGWFGKYPSINVKVKKGVI